MGKGDAGHSVPTKKSERVDAQPGRLNGQRRRGSGRLLEGSHAAQTALAYLRPQPIPGRRLRDEGVATYLTWRMLHFASGVVAVL